MKVAQLLLEGLIALAALVAAWAALRSARASETSAAASRKAAEATQRAAEATQATAKEMRRAREDERRRQEIDQVEQIYDVVRDLDGLVPKGDLAEVPSLQRRLQALLPYPPEQRFLATRIIVDIKNMAEVNEPHRKHLTGTARREIENELERLRAEEQSQP